MGAAPIFFSVGRLAQVRGRCRGEYRCWSVKPRSQLYDGWLSPCWRQRA